MPLRLSILLIPRILFQPCIPTRGTKVPSGPDWLHEIKYDGYRLIVQREGKRDRWPDHVRCPVSSRCSFARFAASTAAISGRTSTAPRSRGTKKPRPERGALDEAFEEAPMKIRASQN